MIKFFLPVMLSFALLFVGCGTDYEKVYKSAERDFSNGKYEDAKKKFQKVYDNTRGQLKSDAEKMLADYEQKVAFAKKEKVEREAKRKAEHEAVVKEMQTSFDYVLSHNKMKSYYHSCAISGDFHNVVVKVDHIWKQLLPDSIQKEYADQIARIYLGMANVRNLNMNRYKVYFTFKDHSNDKIYATWNLSNGTTLY